jgi:hypothetical protein
MEETDFEPVFRSLGIGATFGPRYARAWYFLIARISTVTPDTPSSTPSFREHLE